MPKKPSFPEKLYVTKDMDGDEVYYIAVTGLDGLVDTNGLEVATYSLVNTRSLKVTKSLE